MKSMRKTLCFLMVTLNFLSLCACQKSPDEVVEKKNLDNAVTVSTSETQSSSGTIAVHYEEQFFSTDKTVEFHLNINESVTATSMPIVEVVPHYLSEEDIERVAKVLFGETVFYEKEPNFSPVYSKEEILERINRWSRYTNADAIEELYGIPMDHVVGIVQGFIEDYTLRYEVAPDSNPHELCRWNFKKESQYNYTDEQLQEMGRNIINENDKIAVSLRMNGIEYQYSAITRNKSDYKLNYLSAYPYTGISPNSIDSLIIRSELCRTEEPTEAQISDVYNKAADLLNLMDLGEWTIDQHSVKTTYYGDTEEYVICVSAVPVLNGIAALRRPQLENLKSKEVYASNYYITDVYFEFSPDGQLLLFNMYSPIDIKEIVDESSNVISFDELIVKAKKHFELSDYYAYGFGSIIERSDDEFGCTVDICSMNYGLTRIKVPNSDDSYYYVPSITLQGDVEYYLKKTGEVCSVNKDVTLLILNAVDGSIISISNE